MKLPGLAAVDDAEAVLVDLLIVEVDRAGHADVLLHPRIFDGLGIDAEEALGEIAEGAVAHLLYAKDVLDLAAGEHALLDEKLADLDSCWHWRPPAKGQ